MNWRIDGPQGRLPRGTDALVVKTDEGSPRPTVGCNQAYLQTGYYRPDEPERGCAQPTENVHHAGDDWRDGRVDLREDLR